MKILVTGGTGFLGKHLCYRLKQLKHQVLAVGRNEKIGQELIDDGIDFRKVDLSSKINVSEAVDIVVHCAALCSPWGKYDDFYKANVVATANVIQSFPAQRFIHISTSSVYFNFKDRFNVKESDSLTNRVPSLYTKTKLLAERLVATKLDNFIILRPRGIFGPGDNAIFPRLIKTFTAGKLPIIGNGENYIDLTYVDNVVDAIILCFATPTSALRKIYNITNDEPIKLWDYIKLILTKLGYDTTCLRKTPYRLAYVLAWFAELTAHGKEPLLTRYAVGLLAKNQTLDISLAKRELGYQAKVSMVEAVDKVVKWWKSNY